MLRNTAIALLLAASTASAQELWNNGTWITNPTGGTSTIAGLPISNPEIFFIPGITNGFYTTGVSASAAINSAIAEDFTVPAGEAWSLGTLTI